MVGPYETMRIPLGEISEHPENDYSMDERGIEALAASIERDGLGQLPLVRERGDGWQDGRRAQEARGVQAAELAPPRAAPGTRSPAWSRGACPTSRPRCSCR